MQDSKCILQSHLQAKQDLVAERQALLQQQAAVLQEHVRAGVPLPGSKPPQQRAASEEQRQQLIAQLVQQEGPAQAALEALKQGASLAKAREVGQRVMQQARDLQGSNTAAAAAAAAAAAGAGGGGATVGALQLPALLQKAEGSPVAGGASKVTFEAARASQQQQQQQLDQLEDSDLQSSFSEQLQYTKQQQQQQDLQLYSLHEPQHNQQQGSSKHHRLRAHTQQQQEQQQAYSPVQQHWGGSQGSVQRPPGAAVDVAALQQQVAMLQHSLVTQQLNNHLTHLNAHPQLSPAAAAAAAGGYSLGLPSPTSLQAYPQQQSPVGALGVPPSVYAGPGLMVPTEAWGQAAAAAAAALPGVQMAQTGYPVLPGMSAGAAGGTSVAAAGGGGGDAALASAVASHVRDMTLLRMDVERTRATAELQQARAELAALQRPGPAATAAAAAGGGGGAGPDARGAAAQLGLVQQQQQQQQQRATQVEEGVGEDDTHDADHQEGAHGRTPQTAGDEAWLSAAAAGGDSNDHDSDTDNNLQPPAAAAAAAAAADSGGGSSSGRGRRGTEDREVLSLVADGVLSAARGSGGSPDVLQVHVTAAGPFSKRGAYRVAVVLYDGFQPMAAGLGAQVSASTGRRNASTQPTTLTAAGDTGSSTSATSAAGGGSAQPGVAVFHESLSIKGVRLSSSLTLVFELYCAKTSVAGLPTKELLVAWAATPLLQGGQVLPGLQSLPLLRLPILLSPGPVRHWSYDGALIDFRLVRYTGTPGDVDSPATGHSSARGPRQPSCITSSSSSKGHEDLPGVPTDAWVRVSRGLMPSEPYTQGDGIVVVVDGARFLPACTTISRVVASVWSSSGMLLAGPWEGPAQPSSDARSPAFMCKASLDVAQANTSFDDPTATLLLQVHTLERSSRQLRVVGFALLALFLDPRDGGQPQSRSISDYVLNNGAFQVPLHAGAPPTDAPLRMSSLDDTPRVPCTSLLLRVMTPDAAKAQRRKPVPQYQDRVYDSVSRCMPTGLERKLYGRLLAAHTPWSVREAARLVAWYRCQPGGLAGHQSSSSSSSSSRRTTSDTQSSSKATPNPTTPQQQRQRQQQQQQRRAVDSGVATLGGGTAQNGGGLLKRLLGGLGGGESDRPQGAVKLNAGDPAAAVAERQEDLEAAKAELLPPNDGDIMDWMSEAMSAAESAAITSSRVSSLPFINFNLAIAYLPDLGFCVAVDGAMRLARPLPAAAIISSSPPGSMYQDHPLVDDVRLTLDYDLDAPLSAPRWLDGYQAFTGLPHSAGLVVIVDVRCLVPGSSTASPAGWSCLPVFEAAGPYVASGVYHLPLFQGIPSTHLLAELSEAQDPDAVMAAALQAGRVRPTLDQASVCVRLVCGTRQGLEAPAWSLPLSEHRLTRYTVSELGAGFVGEMRKHLATRTYAQAKPRALTDEQWVDQINDTLLKISGLEDTLGEGHRDD